MKLNFPFIISPRLLPALEVGKGNFVQLEYATRPGATGRVRYQWTIDLAPREGLPRGGSFSMDDIQSGCQGGNLLEGFGALLSFLSASAESRQGRERRGETEIDQDSNETLFPSAVVDFACEFDSELSMLAFELEENPEAIKE